MNRAFKPCAKTRCPQLVMPPTRWCPQHAEYGRERTKTDRGGTTAQRGYDKDWEHIRESVMVRDRRTCQLHLFDGRPIPATSVHHVRPVAEFPELRLDPDNCVALCDDCHASEDNKRRRGLPTRIQPKPLVEPKMIGGFF
jgi:5-methylcytosine-specific restriction enzyme A